MTNTGFLVRHRGHQRLDTHRSKMKSRSSSAPGAPGFILPASSLPCASADFRRVWRGGKKRRYSLRRGEVETRTTRRAALQASIRAALAADQKITLSRGKNKHRVRDVWSLPGLFPSGRGPGGGQRGEEILLRSSFGSAGIVSSPPSETAGAFAPQQRRDGESRCPPPHTKAPTILTSFQINFIYQTAINCI